MDILIDHPCGSKATCGKCRVRFTSGSTAPTAADERLIPADELADGWRLSCQCMVEATAEVEVPAISRSASAKSFGPDDLFAGSFSPRVQDHEVMLPEPTIEYQYAAEDSLNRQLNREQPVRLTTDQIRWLSTIAREGGSVRLLRDGARVLALGPSHEIFRTPFGIAIDIGSTSLAAALVDKTNGRVLSHVSSLNPQVRHGADVISRIDYVIQDEEGNSTLHRVLIEELARMIAVLQREARVDLMQIWSVCVAGNPAMLHTFMGVDVTGLALSPYVGAWTRGLDVPVQEVGRSRVRLGEREHITADLHLRAEARVRTMPMIRSNVGGDTVAALIASGMDQNDKLSILVDLGTNCEVVIGNRDRLIATSTAAGPAFEGANIAQGMRAAPGAIDRVSLKREGRLAVRVIGNDKAKGICGSGLIDTVPLLLRTGVVDASGRMHSRDHIDEKRYPQLARRIVHGELGYPAVILAFPEESEREIPVMLNAHDVRQLQLIKGSILAGCRMLMDAFGARAEDLDQILIAGAFGSFLRKQSVVDIGLVPAIDPEKIHFIGNAAGVGARMALVDENAWRRAELIHERAEYIELGGDPQYQYVFAEAMGFHDSPAVQG